MYVLKKNYQITLKKDFKKFFKLYTSCESDKYCEPTGISCKPDDKMER